MNTAFDKEQFRKNRDNITNTAFDEFNRTVFQGWLGKDVVVQWSKRLRTTAGLTWLTFFQRYNAWLSKETTRSD